MELLIIILFFILMFHLGQKGKAYRVEKRIRKQQLYNTIRRTANQPNPPTQEEILQRQRDAEERTRQLAREKQEAAYRKELEDRGFNEETITIILPQVMSDWSP